MAAHIRGRGIGATLLSEAIRLAQSIDGMAWLDLRVMAENKPARALYKKFGFEEQGYIKDRFRISGRRIDEVMMTLPL